MYIISLWLAPYFCLRNKKDLDSNLIKVTFYFKDCLLNISYTNG